MIFEAGLLSVLFDSLNLALCFVFLMLLLWHDWRKRQTQILTLFLLMLVSWNVGLMIARNAVLSGVQQSGILFVGIALVEGGIAAANVAVYAFISSLTGSRSPRIFTVAYLSIALVVVLRLMLSGWIMQAETLETSAVPRIGYLSTMFYVLYTGATLYALYVQRRRITNGLVRLGCILFATGQFFGLLNSDVGITSLSTNAITLGALFIVLSLVDTEMIKPLAERSRQVETLHHVNQEIVGQPQLLKVLDEIAKRAIEWVNGDAGGVFLLQGDQLVFTVGHNMPESYLGLSLSIEHGVAGQTVRTGRSQYIEAYHMDWKGVPDFPHAKLAFGSVIAVPITSKDATYGVLMAITGRQGRLLRRDDVYRLELLAPQAALTLGYAALLDIKTALAEKIEESRLQLETLLFSTESPVIAVDRKMRLIFANPAAYDVIGLGDSVVGDNIATKLPLHLFMDDWLEIVRKLHRDNSVIFEVTLGKRIYQCHLARLGRLKMGGWVAVLNDVTQLKELDRMKGEMIRMVSHDLKNPLMSAMLQIDLMRYRNHDHPDETIDQMERQLERMDRIIRGVLDVERLRSGSLKLSPAYVGPIIEKAVDDLQRLALDSGVDVSHEVDHSVAILCDETQVERAISNLVENAIKFTPKGGTVVVRMAVQEEHIIIMVRDSGIGIPSDIQPLVFQRFFRGRQKGFEYATGTGLGLALVQAIMDSHQGHVWFESREGEGTVFYLRFKRAELPDDIFFDE